MIFFVDSSALVKLYVEEPGSDRMRSLADRERHLAASDLAFAEIHASFARRRREGHFRPEEFEELAQRWTEDWQSLMRVPIGAEALAIIPGLCETHPLRGADAIHLASALLLQEHGLEVTFTCSDRVLLEAARSEGLFLYDPTLPSTS